MKDREGERESAIFIYMQTLMKDDDAEKFTSEMHDPCARSRAYKRE